MKRFIFILTAFFLILAASTQAQLPIDGSHYPVGSEGIKAGSLPDEGIYFRDDNYFYTGTANSPANFNTFIYAQLPQLTWITDWKFLDANYGMNIMIPIVYKQANYTTTVGFDSGGHPITASEGGSRFGLGDVQIEPLLLSWHLKHFDFMASGSVWIPTGNYDNSSAVPSHAINLGDGCWSPMIGWGGTWYLDDEKKWAVSILNHFEFNSQISGIRYHTYGGHIIGLSGNVPCSTYSLEWGVSKTIYKETDLGIIGYYQRQFAETDGASVFFKDATVAGIGPEIRTQLPSWNFSLRYAYEFLADSHPQGHTVNFTVTKQF